MIKAGEWAKIKIEEKYELPNVNPILVLGKLKFKKNREVQYKY